MKENVFLYEGEKGDLVQICYDLLMTGKVITYENVLTLYDGGILKVASPTKHPQYKTLQKVFPEVINSLIYYGYSIIQISRGRNTDYQYVDSDRDPLKNIRLIAKLQKLYNEISECVKLKTPITFTYCPFDRKKREIVFHPHLMQKYNNRFFSIGVAETEGKKPFRKYVIALDRISGTIKASSHTYIIPMINEYTYLSHLVGVTLEKDTELIIITLRAHDKYTFGRLTTKPLHFSQKIIAFLGFSIGHTEQLKFFP